MAGSKWVTYGSELPEEIWEIVSESAGLDKSDFDSYYAGRDIAHALEIVDVWEFENAPTLETLKQMWGKFVVPQSWRYVKPDEYQAFQDMVERSVEGRRSFARH